MKTEINLQTKVANLLEAYPELENRLTELSPVFSKLKNPILRRTIAKVTNLGQAAEITGISPPLLIKELRSAVGLSDVATDTGLVENADADTPPVWFYQARVSNCYDARPTIEAGESPMQDILKLASLLRKEEILQVITSFKPVPIIEILQSKGFESWSCGNDNFFYKK